MQKQWKRGFTTPELVIVIVVIVILAAVLIPTFVILATDGGRSTDDPDTAADIALARNMNDVLAETASPASMSDLVPVLAEHGYRLDNLSPAAEGNVFVWNKTTNRISYLGSDGTVLYTEDVLPTVFTPSPDFWLTVRSAAEMENHFECLWDLFRSIPSIETEGVSVLDEYYWLNKHDPNYSLMRATVNRGEDAHTDGKFGLSDKGAMEIMKLFFTPDEELYDKKITEYFDEEVLSSNFWLYWRTMFAFENWHSALEMKLYIKRFIHHVGGLPDFSALRFTRYNQYESMILPMISYLESHGVQFHYNTKVVNVIFDITDDKKKASGIDLLADGETQFVNLGEDDLVFITPGGCVENSTYGSQNSRAEYSPCLKEGGGWDMWKKIAAQDPSFGNPEKFCSKPEETTWMSATVTTLDDRIIPYIRKICRRDPFSGNVVTGGIVTVKDSSWLLSWTINRQPQFRNQKEGQCVIWLYGLFFDRDGDYIHKPMKECTGKEICEEWLYHLGVPEELIGTLAEESANTVPVMMPYITAFFMPRRKGDRPDVVPKGSVNFAFIGQFAETERDTIFTTEYSMRTGMEAVYTLLDIDRGVPEVWGSTYDIRDLLNAAVQIRDGRPVTDMNLSMKEKMALHMVLEKIRGTDIEKLLKEYHVI